MEKLTIQLFNDKLKEVYMTVDSYSESDDEIIIELKKNRYGIITKQKISINKTNVEKSNIKLDVFIYNTIEMMLEKERRIDFRCDTKEKYEEYLQEVKKYWEERFNR